MAPPYQYGSSPCNASPLQRAFNAKQSSMPSRSSFPRSRSSWSEDVTASQSSQCSSTARFSRTQGSSTFAEVSSGPCSNFSRPNALEACGEKAEGFAPRVVQGFVLSNQGSPLAGDILGVSNSTGTAGLLSRQLSQRLSQNCDSADASTTRGTTEAYRDIERKQEHRRRLARSSCEQPLGSRDTRSPANARPPLSDSLLLSLQERHAVFRDPVVKRAFSVAATAFAFEAQLKFNAKTAIILADLRLDANTVAATLLYDAVRTSSVTHHQLPQLLPPDVTSIVNAAARIDHTCALLRTDNVKDTSVATQLTTMLLDMGDVRAVLVVLASKLQHMRSNAAAAASGTIDLRVEAEEGLRVFAPLANRLGVWKLKAELEDLCFMVLQPAKAQDLQSSLAKPQSLASMNDVLTALKSRLDADDVAYNDLTGRPKNLYGVHQKLRRKGFFAEVSEVHDARGLRLIVDSKQDCWAALRAVESLWQPIPNRFKDYIRNPKPNGYQSLHTVVTASDGLPLEIQIRTSKMHYIAEYGVAAHWRYKEALEDPSGHTDRLVGWSRWLITWQMELEDGKCRPQGSPPRDTSLSTLFPAPFSPATAEAASNPPVCAFPQHAADCRFATYVQSNHFSPQATAADRTAFPVYIVLLGLPTQDTLPAADSRNRTSRSLISGLSTSFQAPAAVPTQIRQLPAGTTVGDLVSGTVGGIGAMYSPADVAASTVQPRLQVLVNQQPAEDMMQLLASGDEVKLIKAGDQPQLPQSLVAPTIGSGPRVATGMAPTQPLGSVPAVTSAVPAGNILPTGGLGKRLSAPRAAVSLPRRGAEAGQRYGSPTEETARERSDRMGRLREAISRAYEGPPAAKPAGVICNDSSWDEDDYAQRPRPPSNRINAGGMASLPPGHIGINRNAVFS